MADWMSGLGSWDWGDMFGSGNSGGSNFDWGNYDWSSLFGGSGGSGGGSSGGTNWGSFFGNLLNGFSGNGSDGNIWGQILAGGINGYASAGLNEKLLETKGKEDRKSTAFEAELVDYYKQQDKARKRAALDTYGQFSTIKNYAPNYTPAPAVQVPTKPTP
jgi:hypothetical protein